MSERTRHKIILTLRDHRAQRFFDPWDSDEPFIVGSHKMPSGIGAGFLPDDAPSRGGPICAQYWPDTTGGRGSRVIPDYAPRPPTNLDLFGGSSWEIPCELGFFGRIESEGEAPGQARPIRNMDLEVDEKYARCELVGEDPFPPCLPFPRSKHTGPTVSSPPGISNAAIAAAIALVSTGGGGSGSGGGGGVPIPPPPVTSKPRPKRLNGQYDEHNEKPQARSVGSPLPAPWPALRVAATEKSEQHPLVYPAFTNVLIADRRSEQADRLTFSTRVSDLMLDGATGRTQIDQERLPTLSSVFVAKKAVGRTCGVALTLGAVPTTTNPLKVAIGGGFFESNGWLGIPPEDQNLEKPPKPDPKADRPTTQTKPNTMQIGAVVNLLTGGLLGGTQERTPETAPPGLGGGFTTTERRGNSVSILAHMGESYGGPISAGAGARDRHLIGINEDQEPQNPGHFQLLAPWILGNSELYDAPPEFDQTIYEPAGSYGVWWETRLRYDPTRRHGSVVGERPGLMRWETRVPLGFPIIPDPFPPPPPKEPPPEDQPFPPEEKKPDLVAGGGLPGIDFGGFDFGEGKKASFQGVWAQPAQFVDQAQNKKSNVGALVHIWNELASTGIAFQPTLKIPGRDVRHTPNPNADQLARDVYGGPISLRMEPYGAQRRGAWIESNKGATGRLLAKPSVAGGVFFMPAERDTFGSNTRGTVPTRYVGLYEDDVRLAWGTPILSGTNAGGVASGFSTGLFSSTVLATDYHDANGARTSAMTLSSAGTLSAVSMTSSGESIFDTLTYESVLNQRVKNVSGATLTAPLVVKANGYNVDDAVPTVIAIATTSDPPLGILLTDLATATVGSVARNGATLISGLDTSTSYVGAPVYSTAAGALTLTPGSLRVGFVLDLANPGRVIVEISAHKEVLTEAKSANFNAVGGVSYDVSTSGGAVTVTLPEITQLMDGRKIVVTDTGNAATNNITLTRSGASDTIMGAASATMITDYASVTLIARYSAGASKWQVT